MMPKEDEEIDLRFVKTQFFRKNWHLKSGDLFSDEALTFQMGFKASLCSKKCHIRKFFRLLKSFQKSFNNRLTFWVDGEKPAKNSLLGIDEALSSCLSLFQPNRKRQGTEEQIGLKTLVKLDNQLMA